MINLFFPYYQCGDKERQQEIDLCLRQNIANKTISKLIVLIDDNSVLPFEDAKITTIYLESRPTYKKWLELTQGLVLSGVSVLCNSDIYFDDSINVFKQLLSEKQRFVALSRWEVIGTDTKLHPNPHWSQDVWAIPCSNDLTTDFLRLLDFPMGVPRCDNKITYLFGILGWDIYNPCKQIKSYHVHETDMRTYKKKLDDRILGGVAYPHPGNHLDIPAELEFDVYVKRNKNIKGVKINNSLEKWRKQYEDENNAEKDNEQNQITFAPASIEELIKAFKSDTSVLKQGANFEMFMSNNTLLFKNGYRLNKPVKLVNLDSVTAVEQAKLFAFGIIPPVLDTFISNISLKAENAEHLNFWQYPCATEKQAYESHLALKHGEHIDWQANLINLYLPLPWATYIDRKAFPLEYLTRIERLITRYREIAQHANLRLKVHTVCQHIHWVRILETARGLGVTDIHLSHKDSKSEAKQRELNFSFNLHGWPLIAVNYVIPERSEGMERKPIKDKKLIKIIKRKANSGNRAIAAHHLDEHNQKTFKYNSILSDSIFSLCPVGAGPNTLRFWESIAVGSIPVLFSKDLSIYDRELATDIDILCHCVVWEGQIDEGLFEYLASFDSNKLNEMSSYLISAYQYHEKLISWRF